MTDLAPFSAPGRFWRGNLHTHSTLSDGVLAPATVVEAYKAAGYDFMMLSEHFIHHFGWPIADTRPFRSNRFTTIIGSELLMTRWQLREWLEKHVSQIVMTDPVWNGGIAETRKIATLAETFGVPLVLHNVAGPICHAACMHLGAHIPNLYFVESVRAFYQSYFPILSEGQVAVTNGHLAVPEGPGLGVSLRPELFTRPDLTRQVSEGEGLAQGRRAMGDHWAVEAIR